MKKIEEELSSRNWQVQIAQERILLSTKQETLRLKQAISAILDETSSEDSIALTRRGIATMAHINPFMDEIITRGRYSEAKLKPAIEKLPNNPLLKNVAQAAAKFIKASEASGGSMLTRQAMVGDFMDDAISLIKVE